MFDSLFEAGARAAENSWYKGLPEWLGRVGEILAALVAAGAVLGFIRGVYRRALGRRRDRYARLKRLGTHAHISFFSSVLGESPAMRRTEEGTITRYDDAGNRHLEPKTWIECVWIDRDFYVHAVADKDETIHAYSVTTRSKRFHPAFRQPGGWWIERRRLGRLLHLQQNRLHPKIKLGKARFQELGRPEQAAAWMGAHNAHYFEAHWGGNPGLYQWFVYSINEAGHGVWDAGWDYEQLAAFAWGFSDDLVDPQLALARVARETDYAGAQRQELGPARETEEDVEEPLPSWYEAFRRRARINTYTVLGPELPLDDYPFFTPQGYPTIFGPNITRVRTLPGGQNG